MKILESRCFFLNFVTTKKLDIFQQTIKEYVSLR